MTIYQVDAFTDTPFVGNPAGVCVLDAPRSETWMQAVAREMNLSETAFLVRPSGDTFDLRWFTPEVEVDLCGHATLASAHLLWEHDHVEPDVAIYFETASGRLSATREGDAICLDFPAEPVADIDVPDGLADALGAEPHYVGRNRMDVLVEVADAATVRTLAPDLTRLAQIEARGIIVTAPGDDGYDFVSRFFGPASGVPEDPVTGSAHCALGPYWQQRLGKDDLVGYQASARGGAVRVRPRGDRVDLLGYAVTAMRCELLV